MKHLKQFLLMAMLLFTLAPLQVSAKENIDVKEILWGHIKDSYEWHITKVGDHPVVIHLPIIVNTTSGWHVFCSSEFSEERDANGDRPGPYNLVIKNGDAQTNPNKIVEKVGGQEVRPLDISITKCRYTEECGAGDITRQVTTTRREWYDTHDIRHEDKEEASKQPWCVLWRLLTECSLDHIIIY